MGIGYQSKTLKEMVEEKEQLFEKTGFAYGLEKLDLVDEDPVKLMKFQSRLIHGCVSARETGKLIAASPAALMMGELLFMVATPAGDVVCSSHGLVGHIQCVPFFIKSFADLDYETNPGIREGDLFSCNIPVHYFIISFRYKLNKRLAVFSGFSLHLFRYPV